MTITLPRLDLKRITFRVLPMRTRFPFKYGIASLTALPHLVLQAEVEVDGVLTSGVASEGLPPKWFTKSTHTTFEQDLPAMLAVINHAAGLALDATDSDFFELWHQLFHGQNEWAKASGHPELLGNLGVSLVERVLLDALGRRLEKPAHQVIRQNLLGLRLGEVRSELGDLVPADVLPAEPVTSIVARHTIGLGDPLTPAEVTDETRANDSLPLDLESCIREYNLNYFKIKVCGKLGTDLPRLRKLAGLLPQNSRFTLDGNEQYPSIAAFREHWEAWREDEALRTFLDAGLLLVEQPAHRDETFAPEVADDFCSWPDRPPFIIDEADADLESLPAALALGYDGVSHKNCKGIVKGIANAATLTRAKANRERPVHLSGEDLANVGPVALLQDLAIMATLGITHVERNGHHYFKGLSAWPEHVRDAMLAHHGDLYRSHTDGYPTLRIENGRLDLTSLNAAPLGPATDLSFEDLPEVNLAAPQAFLAAGMPSDD